MKMRSTPNIHWTERRQVAGTHKPAPETFDWMKGSAHLFTCYAIACPTFNRGNVPQKGEFGARPTCSWSILIAPFSSASLCLKGLTLTLKSPQDLERVVFGSSCNWLWICRLCARNVWVTLEVNPHFDPLLTLLHELSPVATFSDRTSKSSEHSFEFHGPPRGTWGSLCLCLIGESESGFSSGTWNMCRQQRASDHSWPFHMMSAAEIKFTSPFRRVVGCSRCWWPGGGLERSCTPTDQGCHGRFDDES